MKSKENITRNILLFTLLVNGLAWLGPMLGGSPTEPGLGLLVWGSAPLVAALIMKFALHDRVSLGLKPKVREKSNRRFYLLSICLYPLTIGVVLLVGLLLGIITLNPLPLAALIATLLPLTVIYFVFAFFEEMGWRGYLAPKAHYLNDGLLGHLIVGLIWASWHLPYMSELWAHTNEGLATLLPRFVLGTVISTIVYGEIRLCTGSVWPAVLMHWLGNTIANGLLTTIVVLAPGYVWFSSFGVEGVLMMILFALVGVLLYQGRRRKFR